MKNIERSRLPDKLEIPGLYPPRRRRLPNWPIWLWLVIVAVAAIPMVGVPAVALAHYTTSSPEFCLSCHATGETPNRGIPSKVHPSYDQVSCVDCHAKPGQIVFEGYVNGFQAEPERVSSNCIRCHSDMPKRTDQAGFKFNVRGIAINHQVHLDRGVSCVTCHSNVAHDTETPQTNRPRMETCYTCHSQSESCTKCHAGGIPQAEPSRETVGRRAVPPPQPPKPAGSDASKPAEGAASAPAAAVVPAASIEEGKGLFSKLCIACHGANGSAMPSANLSSKAFLEGQGAEALAKATAEGKGGMPPFGAAKGGPLSDQQAKAVVDYLLSAAN